MRSKTFRTEARRRAACVVLVAVATGSAANSAVFHTQRLHNPANTGGQGVEIEPYGGGFVYLANHTSPYLLPLSLNERPTLVFTDSTLTAAASYTFMRPNETTQLLPTQLYLDSRDFAKTADGGFIICGNYAEGDAAHGGGLQYGAFLLRIDGLSLQPLWFRQYPATDPNAYVSDIQFNSVVETSIPGGGGFVVAGQITDTLLNEALIAGFDSVGNPLWTQELTSFDGGFGVATEVINYDAESVAITGYAGGRMHVHCQNNLAHADVLVARFQNDGTPLFVSLYGQSIGVFNETVASFAEIGASLTRPNGSPDLVITGNTRAWATANECIGGSFNDDMLAFRVDPSGAVVWANRYGLPGAISVGGVQIKPISAFLAIAAQANTLLNGTVSDNVAYYRLMAGGGSLAAQTEVFGGDQVDSVAGIIPLGPPYPTRAVMVGTSESFGTPFAKPYLIDRQVFAQRHCNDAMVPSLIQPVILPQHEVLITTPRFPMRSQDLLLLGEEIYDQTICGLSGGVDTGGSVTVEQIFQIPNPTPSPIIDPSALTPAAEETAVAADNP